MLGRGKVESGNGLCREKIKKTLERKKEVAEEKKKESRCIVGGDLT